MIPKKIKNIKNSFIIPIIVAANVKTIILVINIYMDSNPYFTTAIWSSVYSGHSFPIIFNISVTTLARILLPPNYRGNCIPFTAISIDLCTKVYFFCSKL